MITAHVTNDLFLKADSGNFQVHICFHFTLTFDSVDHSN